MLKDSWKDKINGESIVDAEDINEIAHSIINLEKSGGVSVEIVQETGESESAVMSQKATTDALAGKVDRTEQALKVYGTKGVGPDGNIIHEPYDVDIAAMKAGTILQASAPTNSSFDRKVPTATFAICDPQKPYQPATKQYVDDGLAGKLNALPVTSGYWAYATTPKDSNTRLWLSGNANSSGNIPWYVLPQNSNTEDGGATINVTTPVYPLNAANKQFVEDAIDKATANIREAAVGTLYITQQVHNMNEKAPIPTGALPYAYLEHVDEWCMVGSRDGDGSPTMVGRAKVMEIRQVNDTTSELATMPPTIGQYFKLEDGATHLYLVLGDVEFFDPNNIYYNEFFVTTSVLYQVKVGG